MEYIAHPAHGAPGGTFTQAQARELVAYAAQYHVTIIPEQEAFGHLHYLLNWEQYSPLAETPHGDVLAPGQPGSIKLTHDMFTELANIYPGPFLHLGADETVRTRQRPDQAEVDAQGLGAVYLDYLQRSSLTSSPSIASSSSGEILPCTTPTSSSNSPTSFKQATIAVAWDYNPQPNGYARYITPFTDAHIETWVAPGINNWSRVYPNCNNGLSNIQQFTRDGQRLGATGQLNTIWNDDGEALANNDWYGILFGAEAAWHQGEASIPAFQVLLRRQLPRRPHRRDRPGPERDHGRPPAPPATRPSRPTAPTSSSGSTPGPPTASTKPPRSAPSSPSSASTPSGHRPRRAGPPAPTLDLRENDALDALDLGARRMDLIGLKFQISDEIAADYAAAYALQTSTKHEDRKEVSGRLEEIRRNGKLEDLRKNYSLLRDLYRKRGSNRNRPYFLTNNLERYDLTIQLWLQRMDQFNAVVRQWDETQTIPPPGNLGIPLAAPTGYQVQGR